MTEAGHETLERDGLRLAFRDEGRGAPPLVFLHGWGGSHEHFAHAIDRFAIHHRVLAPDLRGFGNSDQPSAGYAVEELADELAWLCAQRDVKGALLVGHSLGGAVALAAGARHPELARGLLLFEPAIFFPAAALARIDVLVADLATARCHEAACAYVTRFNFLREDDPIVRESVLAELRECAPHVLHAAFAAMRAFDAETSAGKLRVPVRMVDGARPFVERERFLRCCPHLSVSSLPRVGHYQPLLDPEGSAERIEEFLGEVRD